jgi:hypothetical protein
MRLSSILLTAVAAGAIVAPAVCAQAAPTQHRSRHHAAAPRADGDRGLRAEVDELKAEVASLHQEVAQQRESQASTQTEVAQTHAEVAQTSAQVGALHDQVATTPPAVTQDQVHTEIASALDSEHKLPYVQFKGIHITPGGFLEAAGLYRQRNMSSDIATNFSTIPFRNASGALTSEGRFSARQSRLSFLAEGKPNAATTLSMWGEFDFLGAAQTANSNESNSYTPRIRNLYATIDWNHGDSGWHVLAGQNWSLVTMNSIGITPRTEASPGVIDAQYVVGFAWARQPQFRLTGDFADHHLWLAVSAENPQTTFAGSVPAIVTSYDNLAGAGGTASAAGGGGSLFNSANKLSTNSTPDFVGKAAYQGDIAGHTLHLEGFALDRTYTAHIDAAGVSQNVNKGGYGFGGGVMLQVVPKLLDVQFSGMWGKGIGRYGTSGLPDVAFDATGAIHPIKEFMLLGGATLHPTKMLDIYGYAGEEQEHSDRLGTYGIGLLNANDSGCFVEGGTCGGNTRRVAELTAGFWDKIYSGSFGRAQFGIQYSHTTRELFYAADVGSAPQTSENIGMFSFRYYPF